MKIAPLKVNDPWYGKVVNNSKIDATALSAVPIEGVVEMELVELRHGGPETNFRPYLHLRGEMVQVTPSVDLPYGVTELPMRPGNGVAIDAFYDFNHEQLATLVSRGYFPEAFPVPEGLTQAQWSLPGAADFLVVAPALADDAPIVFMSVHDQSNLALDEANSGYELAAYFPDVSAQDQHETQTEIDAPQRSAGAGDMFRDVEFEQFTPVAASPTAPDTTLDEARRTVPDGVFSRLIAEIVADQPVEVEVETEAAPENPKPAEGSVWDLYMQKVAPGVERTLAGEVSLEDEEPHVEDESAEVAEPAALERDLEEPSVVPPAGFLDFSAEAPEADLVPLSQQIAEASDHDEAAARRAARLRSQLTFDNETSSSGEAEPDL